MWFGYPEPNFTCDDLDDSTTQLAELFQIDKTTVSDEIHHVVPIFRAHFQNWIHWPAEQELLSFRGSYLHFPNAVLTLDCTIHPIWKPTKHHERFYRGDKKRYCFNSLLVSDPYGYILRCETGNRATNDTGAYNVSRILSLPNWAKILADGGFPNRAPLIIPLRRDEASREPQHSRINSWHRFHRSEIENC